MPCITKEIRAFGAPMLIGCDGVCDKAWGVQNRPRVSLSADEDDYAFLADDEVGYAPTDPGTYEGGHAKPVMREHRLNKWCFRECERCTCARPGEPLKFPNYFTRRFNKSDRQQKADNGN